MIQSIEDLWLRYRRVMLPVHLDSNSERRLRRTFFFGAKDTLDFVNATFSGSMPPTDADQERQQAINRELRKFAAEAMPEILSERVARHRGN